MYWTSLADLPIYNYPKQPATTRRKGTTVTEKRKAKLLKLTEDVSSPDFTGRSEGGPPLLFGVLLLNLVYRGLPYQPCIFRSHGLEH